MTFTEKLFSIFGRKESQARVLTSVMQVGRAQATPANYEAFAKQGFSKNLIVYAAISKITTSAKGIRWGLYSKSKTSRGKLTQIESHPLLDLIQKPNPLQAQASFFESVIGFKLISGNSYIELNTGLSQGGAPVEIFPVRPDKMKIIPAKSGYPGAYEFSFGGQSRKWDVNPVDFSSSIIHWKSFNPINDWYGLSALEAAMLVLDQNNAGNRWNLSLLQNSATPSGVLQVKSTEFNPRGELSDEQVRRLKEEFEKSFQGARNAGKPLGPLEGGLEWKQISLTPKEMDFLNSREVTAIDLCIALGVPPELMGLGQKTFNNYSEARLSFYEDTVLPNMDDLRDALNMTLTPRFGDGLVLDYERGSIDALISKRTSLMTAIQPVSFLTINEKRTMVGYDEIEGGEELDKPSAPSAFGGAASDDSEDVENDKPQKEPEDETDSEDDESEDEKGFGWKSINLLNSKEKRESWRKQNQRRKQLVNGFHRELKSEWKDLSEKLESRARELQGKDLKLIEYGLNIVASDWAHKDLKKVLEKNLRFTLEDFGGMVLGEAKSLGIGYEAKANRKFDDFVKGYIKRHTATQISTINSTNEKTIRRVISRWTEQNITEGDTTLDLAKQIGEKFSELSDSSAMRIARTEVAMASTNGSLEAVKSLGAPNMWKEWVSASDGRVRDGDHGGADHAIVNGQEMPVDEKFSVPPDSDMDGPGDPSAPADQVINCRCVLTFRSKGQ